MKYIACLLLLFGCSKSPTSAKPLIMTSVPPYVQVVEAIAGNAVTVKSFIKATDDPHTFDPTPRQIEQVKRAALWIGIGEAYEQRLAPFHSRALDLTMAAPLIHGDRHIWMSLERMVTQVKLIAKTLGEIMPHEALTFKKNAESYIDKIQALNTLVKGQLKPFSGDALLVSHPAFYYFCIDYGLQEISLEHEGKEPRPQQIAEILQMAQKTTFRTAFAVPQGSSKGIRLVASQLGIPVFEFNPLSANYLQNMQHLSQMIAQ